MNQFILLQSASDVPFIESESLKVNTVDFNATLYSLKEWASSEIAKQNEKIKISNHDFLVVFTRLL